MTLTPGGGGRQRRGRRHRGSRGDPQGFGGHPDARGRHRVPPAQRAGGQDVGDPADPHVDIGRALGVAAREDEEVGGSGVGG